MTSFLTDHKFFFLAFGCAAFIVTMYHCLLSIFCHPRQLDHIEQPERATGLGEVDIRSIPTHKYITCDKSPKEECPVCLSEFEDGEDLRTLPKCSHTFHVVCIDLWLYSHTNCPTCRTDATPDLEAQHAVLWRKVHRMFLLILSWDHCEIIWTMHHLVRGLMFDM